LLKIVFQGMKRSNFLKLLASTPLAYAGMKLSTFQNITHDFGGSDRTPVIFIGHGSPMNAILDNDFTQTLQRIGKNIEKPNAIMVVSAHWETNGTFVSVNAAPKTIYDFGGFPDAMYQQKYEPAGQPELAREAIKLSIKHHIQEDHAMGLDHGAWTVLKHMFPKQDIPVFQMSMDASKPPQYHFELATALRKMREKGVLVLASGNIVHNLRRVDFSGENAPIMSWAGEFDQIVKTNLEKQDYQSLVNYQQYGELARLAIPTNDHYLPLLYTLGMADKKESVKFLYEGIHFGSISMRCMQFG
jgi:4,5-DOPA dioxygenase extradiol